MITAAARASATVFRIRDGSRHRSMQVLAGYVREEHCFRDQAREKFLESFIREAAAWLRPAP